MKSTALYPNAAAVPTKDENDDTLGQADTENRAEGRACFTNSAG
jgi:hypothetical protein